jgi:hypothetical protein
MVSRLEFTGALFDGINSIADCGEMGGRSYKRR